MSSDSPQSGNTLQLYRGGTILSTTLLPRFFFVEKLTGVIDVLVHAQNHHRRNVDNPWNFGDCMKGRIRFMTAIAPAYAHAYQFISPPEISLTRGQSQISPSSHSRTTTRERGNDFHGWAIYTDGGTRFADGETLAGWGTVARPPHGRVYIYIYNIWPGCHNLSTSRVRRRQNPLQQHH